MVDKNSGNVLFIVSDDLRADCLQLAINGQAVLPNLREFMEDAVTFRRHYTVTYPCGPARASLLTGLYAMNHRSVRNGTPLRADISNLALEVRKSGYEPLLFGYTDTSADPRFLHPNDPAVRSLENPMPGFKEIVPLQLGNDCYAWKAHLKAKGYDLPNDYSRFHSPQDFDPETGPRPDDPAFYRAEDSDTAFLTDACLGELAVRTDQAWLAHVCYIRPHPPFIAPEPYNRMYRADEIPPPARMPTPEAEAAVHPYIASVLGKDAINGFIEAYNCHLDNEDPRDVAALRAVYFGLASEVDHHVGRLVRFLKDTGQYDDTLIIFTSDHGEMLGERWQWGIRSFYNDLLHVPLIIRDPKRTSRNGGQFDAFTESIDVSPTILDWIAGDAPVAMNGASLLPWLEGNAPSGWRDYAYAEMEFGDPECPGHWQRELGLGLREANFAVIQEDRYRFAHFNGGLPPLLFDMRSADGEFRNLADDQDYAGEVLRLTRKMLDHRMRHADHTLSDMKITAGGTVNYRTSGTRAAAGMRPGVCAQPNLQPQ